MNAPFMLYSFPRAVIHVDGDAFFAAVEQALVPALRGRPLVTGRERGIIACASYEAKAQGIARGMPLFEAKKRCPELIILPSDYESYSLFSKRMFNIMRRFTPAVEEYSIDEAFADVTGLRRIFRTSYEQIALRMQQAIHEELGITVSIGLSLSKSLAKLCSKFRKPAGFTAVEGRHIHLLLQRTPLEKVWGFGPNTVELLEKLGLKTAYDFAVRPEQWAEKRLGKIGREIWNELRGKAVYEVKTEEAAPQATIIKSKTFTPPSTEREYVYARLVKNIESAFMKARRHKLRPRLIGVVLRRQDFTHEGLEATLSRPTSATLEVLPLVRELFKKVFRERVEYRATLVVLGRLEDDREDQYELFEDRPRIERLHHLSEAVDAVNEQFGKHTIRSATSLFLARREAGEREEAPPRRATPLAGETARQRLNIPRLSVAV
jgi:DNA polymerase-4/DNA polymerase V